MPKWRPEGWDADALIDKAESLDDSQQESLNPFILIDVVADAMLETLRKEGISGTFTECVDHADYDSIRRCSPRST